MKYKVSVYPESFKNRDKSVMNDHTKKITKLIPRCKYEVTLDELACYIENMHVWCPATFVNNEKKQENLESIQIFALDFDGGIDFYKALSRADRYKIPVALSYETMSSVNYSKFRLAFICCQEVADKNLAVLIQNCLCTIFPEADKASKDFSKLYFPGGNIYYKERYFSIYDLLLSTMQYLTENDYSNKARIMKNIAKKSGVVLLNNAFAIRSNSVTISSGASSPPPSEEENTFWTKITKNEDFTAITIYNNMVDAQKSSNLGTIVFGKGIIYKTEKSHIKQIRVDLDNNPYCQLLNDFISGKRLSHDEWFGLSLNLIHIIKGQEIIKSVFNKYSNQYGDVSRKWEQVQWAVKNECKAQKCEYYCPYSSICNHKFTMVSTLKTANKDIIKLDTQEKYIDIRTMRERLKSEIENGINSYGITVCKAPTGAGKTYAYLEAVKNSERQTIVAVPNKMLMNAIAYEASLKNIEFITTPVIEDLIRVLDPESSQTVRQYYSVGDEMSINYFLRECGDPKAQEYLRKIDDIRKFKGKLIITTHARLLNMKEDYLNSRNVIIDEDPLLSMIQINEVYISEIQKILQADYSKFPISQDVAEKLNRIISVNGYEIIENFGRDITPDEKTVINNRIEYGCRSGVYYALGARCFYHKKGEDEVRFICQKKLPNCNCVILSATADETIYRNIFGSRISDFIDFGELKYQGNLRLHADHTYSKNCLQENPDLLEKLRNVHSNSNVITFKEYAKEDKLYFGAAQGSNHLAGKNLAVIGTFHRPDYVYKLWGMMMGCLDTDDTLAMRRVTRNGFNFPMMTFESDMLRTIQLWMIESEAEQAVGRARLVSNPCIVDLYSNFPLRQCELLSKGDCT